MIGELAFMYLQYYLTMLVAQKSLADLRIDIFAHVQRLEAAFFDRNPVGRLVTRMTTDIDVINEMFAAGAITILMDVVTLLGIVAHHAGHRLASRAGEPVAAAADGCWRSTSSASRRATATA